MDPGFQLLIYIFTCWSFIQFSLSLYLPEVCIGHETIINNRTCDFETGSCMNANEKGTNQLTLASPRNLNCFCDDWCFVYGDCCEDKVKHKGL